MNRTRVRVLHVVENMDDQAVESWLLRILGEAKESFPEYHWTFYSTLGKSGRGDARAQELGADVIHSPFPLADTGRFLRALRATMSRGRFDVLHAHHDIVSAVYLLASLGTGIKRRVVHIHNTAMHLPMEAGLRRRLFSEPMRQICLHLADVRAGISRDALRSMLRGRTPRPGKDVVVYYGIDTARFRAPRISRERTRAEIGVGQEATIMLFAGRMIEYKNPLFLVEMLALMEESMPDLHAVFAGVGFEQVSVQKRAEELGVAEKIRILGWRDDLPELMLASDLLVWPGQEEPKEGLGLGIVEAQAAGLPILMSRSVPDDAIVIPELVSVMPLADGARAWAASASAILSSLHMSRIEALWRADASPFSLRAGTANVIALYEPL